MSSPRRCSCATCSLACGVIKLLCFSCCRRCCCCMKPPPEPKPEFSVLCIGLSRAGKSTLLSLLAGEPMEDDYQPTMGFSIKVVLTSRGILNIKELGGSDRIRPYWNKYYSGHEALIFVVDSCSSDDKINEVRSSLEKCLGNSELKGLPLLLLCNKQDLPDAQSLEQLKERLLLSHLLDERKHLIAGSSCRDKEGLKNSLDVLVGMLLGTEEETQPISMMNS